MKLQQGEIVIIILNSPRERLLGVLGSIEAAGVFARTIDLGYFDDWCSAIASGEPHLEMTDNFFPMWRVERVSREDGSPTLSEQFETRTGLPITGF